MVRELDNFEMYLTTAMNSFMNDKVELFNQPTRKDTFKKSAIIDSNVSLLLDILIKYRMSFKKLEVKP